jgi:apolipoprotein D and lipocalin family protein
MDMIVNEGMKRRQIIGYTLLGIIAFVLLKSCRTIPKNVAAVKPFVVEKYLGRWYEIARFDFKFEKGLNNTTADYSLNEDGTIKIVNRGFDYKRNKWKQSTGKAKFVSAKTEGKLKVSFFGPFYSGYNLIALDADYKYALVCGKNRDYLWILCRETFIPEKIKNDYLQIAKGFGFDVSKLIWIEHNQ